MWPEDHLWNVGKCISKSLQFLSCFYDFFLTSYFFSSLTLGTSIHRLKMFENRVIWGIFGTRKDELQQNGGSCIMRNIMVCTHPQIIVSRSNQGE
jgi:hypothetical protein